MHFARAADAYKRTPLFTDAFSRAAAMLVRARPPRRDAVLAQRLDLPERWVREFRTGAMATRHSEEVDRLMSLARSAAVVDIRCQLHKPHDPSHAGSRMSHQRRSQYSGGGQPIFWAGAAKART